MELIKRKVVALDDGHGEDTAGKRTPLFEDGTFMKENEFNRAVVQYAAEELESSGIDTVFTAPELEDVALQTRTDRANKANADVFVSVHANALTGKWGSQSGIETYIYSGSTKGRKLAEYVHAELLRGEDLKDRGIKEANFFVIHHTKMPAILCECGFMDNKTEASLLMSDAYRRECAKEIAQGICNYFGVPYKPKTDSVEAPEGKLFKVQLGAFRQLDNAEHLLDILEQAGFKGIIKLQ